MNPYTVMNILDLIDSVGENEVRKGLSDFLCPQNVEIENFIRTPLYHSMSAGPAPSFDSASA